MFNRYRQKRQCWEIKKISRNNKRDNTTHPYCLCNRYIFVVSHGGTVQNCTQKHDSPKVANKKYSSTQHKMCLVCSYLIVRQEIKHSCSSSFKNSDTSVSSYALFIPSNVRLFFCRYMPNSVIAHAKSSLQLSGTLKYASLICNILPTISPSPFSGTQ